MTLPRPNPLLPLCIVALLVGASFARTVRHAPFEYGFIEQELRSGAANHVELELVSDTPIVYRAWGIWNFARPIGQIAEVAVDFSNYRHIFRYVYRCDPVAVPGPSSINRNTWYLEGRAGRARVWSIGAIDTLRWIDSTQLRLTTHQNESRRLEQRYYHIEPGMLNYRTRGVRLAAIITAAGRDSCRLGIVAQGVVTAKMPQWLVKLAVGIVLPQLMQDIESEAAKRAKARTPPKSAYDKSIRWLGNAYRSVVGGR